MKWLRIAVLSWASWLLPMSAGATETPRDSRWYASDAPGRVTIRPYFFCSQGCPHCRQALPFIHELSVRDAWLDVDSRELGTRENALSDLALASKLGREAEYSLLFPG